MIFLLHVKNRLELVLSVHAPMVFQIFYAALLKREIEMIRLLHCFDFNKSRLISLF